MDTKVQLRDGLVTTARGTPCVDRAGSRSYIALTALASCLNHDLKNLYCYEIDMGNTVSDGAVKQTHDKTRMRRIRCL
jgi:hypothetical protein